jgi:predicted NAD/FAD-binding protein
VAVTYDMNILQTISSPETFLVSLNMEGRIDPSKVLRRITYHHPVYNANGVAAQKKWSSISGSKRSHYCGAYWGFGFHEDGVASAHRVCESLGVRP